MEKNEDMGLFFEMRRSSEVENDDGFPTWYGIARKFRFSSFVVVFEVSCGLSNL